MAHVDQTLERGLPASVEAERTLLGAALIDSDAVNDCLEFLVPGDLSLDSHRRILARIYALAETGNAVDLITVSEELRNNKELDGIGGVAYLASLSEGLPRRLSVKDYIRIVKDKSMLRQLIGISTTAIARAAEQGELATDILSSTESQLMEMAAESLSASQGFSTIRDEIGDDGIDGYMNKVYSPAEMTGVASGFKEIDEMTGGFNKKELILLAARPSVGKSALMINLATNIVAIDVDAVVAVFSLEMSKAALYKRMVASLAGVNSRRAQRGHISHDERRKMGEALIRIADKHLMIDDTPSITVTQMRAKCRRLKQQMGRLDLVAIDYIQLMSGAKRYNSRQEEIASISRGCRAMAKELDVPVLALAQVSRKAEDRTDKRPLMSDLRESSQLEADADVVAFLHRPEMYAAQDDLDVERGIAEFILAKNREGSTGTVRLAYQAEITKFDNLKMGVGY